MIAADVINAATAVPIEAELTRRGVRLRGRIDQCGPCPVCGGTDRFSVNTNKQVWNCRGCQRGGNVIDLVRHLDGLSFADAIALLASNNPRPVAVPRPMPVADDSDGTAKALAIWREARDPRGTLVETYLANRGLDLPDEAADAAIRFHSRCPFAGTKTPAMVALVRDVLTNKPKAVHRTALTADGRKAVVDGVSRLSLGPVGGGAVKLSPNENVTLCLGIGEGIESTLTMRETEDYGASPVWAVLSAGQMARFPVLPGIEALWLAVDNDPAGINAGRACERRWRESGREVFALRAIRHNDLNDILTKDRAHVC